MAKYERRPEIDPPANQKETVAAWMEDLRPERAPLRDPDECPDPSTTPINGGFFHAGADQRDALASYDEARVEWWL